MKPMLWGEPGSWRASASQVLAPLFSDGKQPTKQELFDAYPFGPREYTPYKVWLEQIRWFKAGCPVAKRLIPENVPLAGQEALL